MDLLNILASFIILSYSSGIQSAPEYTRPTSTPSPTTTVEIKVTEIPTSTPEPTPTFTPGPSPIPKPEITPNKAYKQIKFKSKGDNVIQLQTQLKKYGYYNGDIDGKYGPRTAEAVRIFQKLHSLSPDGIAGKETLTILFESDTILILNPSEEAITPIELETPKIVIPTFISKK